MFWAMDYIAWLKFVFNLFSIGLTFSRSIIRGSLFFLKCFWVWVFCEFLLSSKLTSTLTKMFTLMCSFHYLQHTPLEQLDRKHFAKGSRRAEQNGVAATPQQAENSKEIALTEAKIIKLCDLLHEVGFDYLWIQNVLHHARKTKYLLKTEVLVKLGYLLCILAYIKISNITVSWFLKHPCKYFGEGKLSDDCNLTRFFLTLCRQLCEQKRMLRRNRLWHMRKWKQSVRRW